MKTILPILIFFSSSLIFAQNTAPILDGIVKEQEWQDAQNFSLDYEIDPGDNTPPPHKTKAYIKYTKTERSRYKSALFLY